MTPLYGIFLEVKEGGVGWKWRLSDEWAVSRYQRCPCSVPLQLPASCHGFLGSRALRPGEGTSPAPRQLGLLLNVASVQKSRKIRKGLEHQAEAALGSSGCTVADMLWFFCGSCREAGPGASLVLASYCGEGHWWIHVLAAVLGSEVWSQWRWGVGGGSAPVWRLCPGV